jgi:HopA1 effector protein family
MQTITVPALIDQLADISRAVTVQSPTAFLFAGRQFDAAPYAHQQSVAGYASAGNPLVAAMQSCFYANCYCQPFRGKLTDEALKAALQADLTEQLSEANTTQPLWDSGWQIARIEQSGQVTAQKSGRTRALWPGEFLTHDGPGVPPRVGSQVSVYFPKESKTMQPGFYFAFGEADADFSSDARLVRFYWNISEQGAPPLTRWVTHTLNRYQLPFRFKCLTSSAQYRRTDAAVLYVNKKYFHFAAELVAEACDQLKTVLRTETPLFSRQLAPGLGIAEDPGNGESFGMNRCRILAEGLHNAFSKGISAEDKKMAEVVNAFSAYGLDLDNAYLNAHSADLYDTPAFAA